MDYVSSLSMAMLTLAKRGQRKLGRFWQISFHKSGLKQPTLNPCKKTSWADSKGRKVNNKFNKERPRDQVIFHSFILSLGSSREAKM